MAIQYIGCLLSNLSPAPEGPMRMYTQNLHSAFQTRNSTSQLNCLCWFLHVIVYCFGTVLIDLMHKMSGGGSRTFDFKEARRHSRIGKDGGLLYTNKRLG